MPPLLDVRTALRQGQQLLENGGVPSSRLTAEILLMHAVKQDRAWLYAHASDELKEVHWIHYGRYLYERLSGKPAQYITGHQECYGREFRVTHDVLIPRPETEHVIEAALARMNEGDRVLDIGTGSGAIAVTLALEARSCFIAATDIYVPALRVANENANRMDARVRFAVCDLGSAFTAGSFDVLVSNPPYVALRDRAGLQKEVRDHEPSLALFAGEDGLAVYQRLIPEAARLLKLGGWLVMELGDAAAVRALLRDWEEAEIINDLAGIARVAVARLPGE